MASRRSGSCWVHIDATILLELGLLLIVLTAMSGLAWRVGFTAAPLFLLVGLLQIGRAHV